MLSKIYLYHSCHYRNRDSWRKLIDYEKGAKNVLCLQNVHIGGQLKKNTWKEPNQLQEVTSKIIDGKRNDNCYTYFVDYILL